MFWFANQKLIDLSVPKIMAIWNVTPDSFSSFCEKDEASSVEHARRLCREGADILDIGAESTRPGAIAITIDEEKNRLLTPLIWAKSNVSCPVSLDSRHLETIQWALMMGFVDIINDVGETEEPTDERDGDLYRMVSDAQVGLIISAWNAHGSEVLPFEECLEKIVKQLEKRLEMAMDCGVERRSIVLDPGIGFGKGLDNDMRLIAHAPKALAHLKCPVLIGHSRKRCLAQTTGLPIQDLDGPTAMASVVAMMQGAAIVRVHEPMQTFYGRQIVASSQCMHYD